MLPATYPEGSPEIRFDGIEIGQKQWKKRLFEGSKGKIITQQLLTYEELVLVDRNKCRKTDVMCVTKSA